LRSKSVQNANGEFVGLANFIRYVETPSLVRALFNSVQVALLTTAIVVPLAFVYAYALTRSCMPFAGLFMALALLPIFAPSLLSAISLIYLFGNQGLLKSWMFGGSIYGQTGIIIAEVIYCFPHAVMIIATALRLADGRLYEVAEALRTSPLRVFTTITLPGARYGLISAGFVVFTLVITDFGIPKVIGGQFNVLATDAYKQIVGQRRPHPADAGRARFLRGPAGAEAAGGAALGPRRALSSQAAGHARRRPSGLLSADRRGAHRDAGCRGLGILHQILALQSVAHHGEL
jgi:iron(III) transport system permease protein